MNPSDENRRIGDWRFLSLIAAPPASTKDLGAPLHQIMDGRNWYHVSSHGAVLFWVAADPDCTIDAIAEAMCLTRRTVWGLIGDLRRAGMLRVRKEGRRHHYTVNPDAPLRHPTLKSYTLRAVLGDIGERAGELETRPCQ